MPDIGEAWLEEYRSEDWVEAYDEDQELLGYTTRRDAKMYGMKILHTENPPRYLEDPYVRYHAQLIHRRQMYYQGDDLNDVQMALLASQMVKEREFDAALRERTFEERLMAADPVRYQAYLENKQKLSETEADSEGVEQRVPTDVEEFLATLGAFDADDGEEDTKEQEEHDGWLAAVLSDSDLDQMGE